SRAPEVTMGAFHHSRLEAYRLAVRFAGEVDPILRRVPRWRAPVRDQLLRATCSILANIAGGAGEHSPRDKARFYRIARRSATESAALLEGRAEPGGRSAAPEPSGREATAEPSARQRRAR